MKAQNGHLDICRHIIENIENTNPRDIYGGVTPLHLAAQEGHKEICEVIIQSSEDVNPAGNESWFRETPLHAAAKNGHLAGLVTNLIIIFWLFTLKNHHKKRVIFTKKTIKFATVVLDGVLGPFRPVRHR